MDDLFNFAETQQKRQHIKKPTKEEMLAYAKTVYSKYGKLLYPDEQKYLDSILKEHEKISYMTEEEYKDYLDVCQIQALQRLRSIENRFVVSIKEKEELEIKKSKRKLSSKIKQLFRRILNK